MTICWSPNVAWLLVASAILAPPTARAQATRSLQGLVRDSATGETLPYAQVTVPGTALKTRTNRDGHFVLIGAPAGTATVRVTMLGYLAKELSVGPGTESGRLTVQMSRVPIQLEAVEVVAQQDDYHAVRVADEVVSQLTVAPKDLAALPSLGGTDIFRSLQLLPGISGTNETSAGLYVRGGTPDQTLVLLDGMTVYQVDHFFGFFSAFNADAIKDIQVYKGGFPAQYGGRISSVVDLTGKAGDLNRPRLDFNANLLSTGATGQLPLFGKGSLLFSARRSYTDILQTGLYNSIYNTLTGDSSGTGLPPGPGPGGRAPRAIGGPSGGPGPFSNAQTTTAVPSFYFYDLNVKGTLNPSDGDVVSFSGYGGHDYLDRSDAQTRTLPLGSLGSRIVSSDVTDLTDWGNRGASAKWARQWHPRFYTNGLVSYSEYFSNYARDSHVETRTEDTDSLLFERDQGNLEDNRVQDLTARLDNEWQVAAAHKLHFGAWVTRSDVRYTMTRDDSLTILDRDQQAARTEVYLEDQWQLLPRLSLTLGARGSHYDQTARNYFEPRAAVSWRISDRLTLKGAYGQYHQFVNQVVRESVTEGSRDFWLLADTTLVPVQGATHYIAGVTYETPDFLFAVEAYRKDLNGLAEFSLRFDPGGANIDKLFYSGTGVARGVEFLAQKKFGRYTGWVSYTLGRAENTFPGLNNGEPFPALQDQTHELKAVGSATLGRWTVSSTWTFGSGKPYTAPESEYVLTLLDGTDFSYIHVGEKNGLRLPAYHRLDVAAQYRFQLGPWQGELGLSVFNLYNRANVWYRQFDLSTTPLLVTDVRYLGLTPNLFVQLHY